MTLEEAQAAKLISSQNLRMCMCAVEISQFQDQLADCDLIVAAGGTPLVSRETIERLLTEPEARLAVLQTEMAGLLTALGGE